MKRLITLIASILVLALGAQAGSSHSYRVYFGTYTDAKSKGIYVSRFDSQTGMLGEPELAVKARNPNFLAVPPNHRFLYAVGEMPGSDGKPTGAVYAFSIEPKTGKLTLLNQQPSGGLGPCHVAADTKGYCVLVANYSSGSVASLPILRDGSLGAPASTIQHHGSSINPKRQAGPRAHFITTDPANRFALTCDLGVDKVFIYRLDSKRATLTPNDPPFGTVTPGSGPRHLAFSPNGKFVYVINELGSTLTAFSYDAKRGALKEIQTVPTLPEKFEGENYCAHVLVHPSGKFVYGSNRGHDSIVVFAVDPKSGKLTLAEHQSTQGKTPRNFAIDPSGSWLLAENQASDNVVVFRIDAQTGRLKPAGQTVTVGAPVCAVFVPAD